jgi:hypothetical protein
LKEKISIKELFKVAIILIFLITHTRDILKQKIMPVIYGGYATSGGTVIRDLLSELSVATNFTPEFRIIRERYGLLELEESIFSVRSPENIDLAIKDFLWLVSNYSRKYRRFGKIGGEYDLHSSNMFSNLSAKFIDDISDFSYPMRWFFYEFRKNRLAEVFHRKARQYGISDYFDDAVLAYPTHDKFINSVTLYLQGVMKGICVANGHENARIVGLHNAIPPYSYDLVNKSSKYFDNCRMIFVDRDPRDVFLSLPGSAESRYLPKGGNQLSKAIGFVKFYRSLRECQASVAQHSNVQLYNFEDLVLNYDSSIKSIFNFIEVEESEHIYKKNFFNPENSINGVRLWKNAGKDNDEAMAYIESKLSDFLFDS